MEHDNVFTFTTGRTTAGYLLDALEVIRKNPCVFTKKQWEALSEFYYVISVYTSEQDAKDSDPRFNNVPFYTTD